MPLTLCLPGWADPACPQPGSRCSTSLPASFCCSASWRCSSSVRRTFRRCCARSASTSASSGGTPRSFARSSTRPCAKSELADLKKDVENIARETEASLQATGQTVESSLNEARQSIDTSIDTATEAAARPLRARCRRHPDRAAAAGHRDQQSERIARRRSTRGHLGRNHDPDSRRAATPGREEWRLKG